MAIYIIDGKIGSGKTYYAVSYILKKYYVYDEQFRCYFPRRDIILVTNVDSLKIEHVPLDAEVDKRGITEVFSEAYINELRGNSRCPVVFLIDEAQGPKFFHRKFYGKNVFFFFQYSRHYGVDIFLITQDSDSLAKEIKILPEKIIHAVSRSHTSGLNFHYKNIIADEVESQFMLKRDKKVFKVYQSFTHDETEKPKPIFVKYAIMIIVFALIAVLTFKFVFLKSFSGRMKDNPIGAKGQTKSPEFIVDGKPTPLPVIPDDKPFTAPDGRMLVKKNGVVSVYNPSPVSSYPVPTPVPQRPAQSSPARKTDKKTKDTNADKKYIGNIQGKKAYKDKDGKIWFE
jgi:hypothetical protein